MTNTYCTVVFRTFQDIQAPAILLLNFYGIFVSTNLCSMIYSNTSVPVPILSCSVNTNLNVLTVTLNTTSTLPSSTFYSLLVNGISIDSTEISNYFQLQVMDATGSYPI